MTLVGWRRGSGRVAGHLGPILLLAALASLTGADLYESLHGVLAFFAVLSVAAYPGRGSTLARFSTVGLAFALVVLDVPLHTELDYCALVAALALPLTVGRAADRPGSTLRLAVVAGSFAIFAGRASLPSFHFGQGDRAEAIAGHAIVDQASLLAFAGVAIVAALAGAVSLRRSAAVSMAFLACAASLLSAWGVAALGYALARETQSGPHEFAEMATRHAEWADVFDWAGGAATAAFVVSSLAMGVIRFRTIQQWSLVAVPLASVFVVTAAVRVPSPVLDAHALTGPDEDWRGIADFAPLAADSLRSGLSYGPYQGDAMVLMDRHGRLHEWRGTEWVALDGIALDERVGRAGPKEMYVLADHRVATRDVLSLGDRGAGQLGLVLVPENYFAAQSAGGRGPFVKATLRRPAAWWIYSEREGAEYVGLCRLIYAARNGDDSRCSDFPIDALSARPIASVRELAGSKIAVSTRLVSEEWSVGSSELEDSEAEAPPRFLPLLDSWLFGAVCGATIALVAFALVVLRQLYLRRRALALGRWQDAAGAPLSRSLQRFPNWVPLARLTLVGIHASGPYRDGSVVWAAATSTAGVALRVFAARTMRSATAVGWRIALRLLYGLALASALAM